MRTLSKCLIAAAAAGAAMIVPAGAAPIAAPSALQQAVAATADAQVQTVQWRRGWRGGYWRGGRWIGPAIVGGAIVGGAIVATQPYGYGYYGYPGYYDGYAYDPGYAYVEPGYRAGPPGGDVAYCAQRYRSYDRASGTYLGYDGMRHPCP
jgi:hypothetical protein